MNRTSQDTAGTVTGSTRPDPDVRDASPAGPTAPPSGPTTPVRSGRGARAGRRGAAVVGVTLLAALAATPPAGAGTGRFRDAAGDTGLPADLTTVRVVNGPDAVEITARPGRVEFEDLFTFWLDTRPKNAGPEYKVVVVPNSDAFGLLRVGDFGRQGRPVACEGLRATADHFTPDRVSTSVPWSCLGEPGRVRVAVKARYADGDSSVVDWAPAKRRLFGWVAR